MIEKAIFLVLSFIGSVFSINSTVIYVTPYRPTGDVKAAHGIPKVQDFALTVDYLKGAAVFAIIIFVLGVLSVAIYQFILCCRCCFHFCCPNSCKCCYNKESSYEPDLYERMRHHKKARFSFFAFLLGAVIVNCLVFIGSNSLSKGIRDVGDSMDSIADVFTNLVNISGNIQNALDDVSAQISPNITGGGTCYFAFCQPVLGVCTQDYYSDMTQYISDGNSALQSITDIIGNLPENIHDARKKTVKQGECYLRPHVMIQYTCGDLIVSQDSITRTWSSSFTSPSLCSSSCCSCCRTLCASRRCSHSRSC
jgi:hypothetical protein